MKRRLLSSRRSVKVVVAGSIAVVLLAIGAGVFFVPRGHVVQASGSGDGAPCFVPDSGTPVCHFSGYFVSAVATTQDTSTCSDGVITSFTLYAADNVTQTPPGRPTGSPLASVYYSRYDNCSYEYDYGYGEILGADFKSTGNLGNATVNATIPLTQYGNSTGTTITLSLTWTGVGSIGTTIDTQQVRMGDVTTKTHFKGENRSAVVSGTVSDGVTTFTVATSGDMNSTQTGLVQVTNS